MSDPAMISLGINKRKKVFKPKAKPKTSKAISHNKATISSSDVDPQLGSSNPPLSSTTIPTSDVSNVAISTREAEDSFENQFEPPKEIDSIPEQSSFESSNLNPANYASESALVSLGINKRKKTFQPTVNQKRKRTTESTEKAKENVDVNTQASTSSTFSISTVVNTPQANPATVASTPKKVHSRKSKRKAVPINITAPATPEIIREPSSVESTRSNPDIDNPSSLAALRPMTMQDLNSFAVKATQKDFVPYKDHLNLKESEETDNPTWPIRPISEMTDDPNILYIHGQRINIDKVPSEEKLQELIETLNKRQQKYFPPTDPSNTTKKKKHITMKQLISSIKEGLTTNSLSVEEDLLKEGLDTSSVRREKLVEVSRYDADLESRIKELDVTPEKFENTYSKPVVPQVKLVNGEIVLDTDSLVVEREQPDERQPQSENPRKPPGRPITQRSVHHFTPNGEYVTRKWTALELQVFYDGLTLYGTDFTKIASTIPEKDRFQVKNKFKSEEKKNLGKINEYLMKGNTDPELQQ